MVVDAAGIYPLVSGFIRFRNQARFPCDYVILLSLIPSSAYFAAACAALSCRRFSNSASFLSSSVAEEAG